MVRGVRFLFGSAAIRRFWKRRTQVEVRRQWLVDRSRPCHSWGRRDGNGTRDKKVLVHLATRNFSYRQSPFGDRSQRRHLDQPKPGITVLDAPLPRPKIAET